MPHKLKLYALEFLFVFVNISYFLGCFVIYTIFIWFLLLFSVAPSQPQALLTGRYVRKCGCFVSLYFFPALLLLLPRFFPFFFVVVVVVSQEKLMKSGIISHYS